jgi:hypothetical protein
VRWTGGSLPGGGDDDAAGDATATDAAGADGQATAEIDEEYG